MMRYACVMLLCGCTVWPPGMRSLDVEERGAIQAARDAWASSDRFDPRCPGVLETGIAEVPTDEAFDGWCCDFRANGGRCGAEACRVGGYRAMAVAPGHSTPIPVLVIHEALHSIRECAILERAALGTTVEEWADLVHMGVDADTPVPRLTDPGHLDSGLWERAGGQASIEARAWALIGFEP